MMKKPILILLLIVFVATARAQNQQKDEVYTFVDSMPIFKNDGDFVNYISKNIHYPQNAILNHTQGIVIVQFTIDKDGYVTNAAILVPVSPDLDMEAIRVITHSPKWKPGKLSGKAVNVSLTIPITFRSSNQVITITNPAYSKFFADTSSILNQQKQLGSNYSKFDTTQVFMAVEFPPTFPGGIDKLNEYTATSLKALHNTDDGKVTMNVVVERDGSLTDFKFLKA
jgi:TonB family protein